MTPGHPSDWTRNGARFVCAAILVVGGAIGASASHGHEPIHGSAAEPFATGLDLNTAPAHELELLPGIGPALSRAIIDSRETDGPFADLDDLKRVKGIGDRRVSGIAPHAFVR